MIPNLDERIESNDPIKNLSRSCFLGSFLSSSRLELGFRMKNESNIFSFFAEDDANMYVYDISLLYIEYMPCIFQMQGKILAISSEQIVRLLFFLSRIQIVH